ncbi:PRC-barrel domain-containing protein [Kitasatospora sp. NPDC091207]|uniref:PRC-barrel domain-containing protein n=1 Tax=Kitasatospora sp. NPDC091207 TaxID=3364083 RepID=UPI003808E95F
MSSDVNIWEFRSTSGYVTGSDLVDFRVEAVDGHIGRIDKLSEQAEARYLVVDTGPWIFGKHVLLPAGTVVQVDFEERKAYVDRTKDEIRNGPEFDRHRHDDDTDYQEKYAGYYGPFYGGPLI